MLGSDYAEKCTTYKPSRHTVFGVIPTGLDAATSQSTAVGPTVAVDTPTKPKKAPF